MKLKIISFLSVLFLIISVPIHASTVLLKDGKIIEGTILDLQAQSKDDGFLKFDPGTGVPVTYYFDEIESIDGNNDFSPYHETTQSQPGNPEPTVVVDEPKEIIQEIPNSTKPNTEQPPPIDSNVNSIIKEFSAPLPSQVLKNEMADVKKTVATAVEEKIPSGPADLRQHADSLLDWQWEEFQVYLTKFKEKYPQVYEQIVIFNYFCHELINNKVVQVTFLPAILILHVLYAFPLIKIARKMNTQGSWIGWFPILQIVLLVKMADKPVWWLAVIFLLPLIGIFMIFWAWVQVLEFLQISVLFSVFLMVPILNLPVLWYMAYSKNKQ